DVLRLSGRLRHYNAIHLRQLRSDAHHVDRPDGAIAAAQEHGNSGSITLVPPDDHASTRAAKPMGLALGAKVEVTDRPHALHLPDEFGIRRERRLRPKIRRQQAVVLFTVSGVSPIVAQVVPG